MSATPPSGTTAGHTTASPVPQDRRPVHAAAEVFARPAHSTPRVLPVGQVQIAWVDANGRRRLADITVRKRLDQGPWTVGRTFEVTVQARPDRDLRLPVRTITASLIVTHQPADSAIVEVQDGASRPGWAFGVHFRGARIHD